MTEPSFVKDYAESEAEQVLKILNGQKKPNNPVRKLADSQESFSEQNSFLSMKTNESLKEKDNSYEQNEREVYTMYNPLDYGSVLPILSNKEEIISAIETESVVIIQGPTGCGKSTQIPQFILNSYMKRKQHCNIIVTQPRRIAAISLAKRVDQERQFDHLVSYKVGRLDNVTADTRLTYCTTEILLNTLIYQKHFFKYTHIILDEVHERDQNIDFLLLVVKILMEMCIIQVKVVIMSATMNVNKFAEYFSTRVEQTSVSARIIRIPEKKRFNIHMYYLDDLISCQFINSLPKVSAANPKISSSMIKLCANIIIALDDVDHDNDESENSQKRHTVLIFLPGKNEIGEVHDYLFSNYKDKLWDIIILHSTISYAEQQRIFYKPPKGYRRIILATNIAESSITVPDTKYVIDFCLTRLLRVDSATQYQSLQLCWASKANCTQRAGRAGRIMDGRVYRLIPKAFYYNVMEEEGTPEILRAPLANLVLRAKILDIGEPRTLLSLALDPPNIVDLASTILVLKEAGALANEEDSFQPYDGKLTDVGRIMACLPLDIRISKLILLGHVFGILRDAIVVGASMTLKDIFSNTFQPSVSSYSVRRKWACNSDSDCIAVLNVYNEWKKEIANRRLSTNQDEKQWAEMNGVQHKTLHELDALVYEITDKLMKNKIQESTHVNKVVWEGDDRDFVLQVILAGAFYPNYFIKQMRDSEVCKKEITRTLGGILSPMNTVYLKGWPYDHFGYLYAKKFQKIFSKHLGIPEKQIAVSFDSTRVRIHYCGKKTSVTSLYTPSEFVYKAVRMKLCKIPIHIKVLDDKKRESELAMRYNTERFDQKLYFTTYDKRAKNDVPKIRPELPGLDVTFIPLSIKKIVNPEYFWASLDDDTTSEYINLIEDRLSVHFLKELTRYPEKSDLIAAPMRKNNSSHYQRAVVEESLGNERFSVLFIDHGSTAEVHYSLLRRITDANVLKIPCLAFRCRSVSLRPSSQANLYGQWSTLSSDYFRTQVEKYTKIYGQVYSVVNSVVNLELIVSSGERRININDSLVKKGFAVRTEESYLSEHNHERRMFMMNREKITIKERQFYEEEQYDRDYLVSQYPDPPDEKDCSKTVVFRGPFSPLEMELSQLTRAGKTKKIYIEPNSVNSVLLDVSPDQVKNRLLVAQSVTESSRMNGLILRNTTFLPNIPGFASLLSLCFAPRVELRCNSRQTYYTGALCGLGPMDSCTDRSMFLDNDMEIEFDVEISIEDMLEINRLRYWMNDAMQVSNISDNEFIVNCQNRIKHILYKLRHRQRKPLEPPIDRDDVMYKWNTSGSYFRPQPSPEEKKESCDIYSLHKVLQLYDRDEKQEELVQNVVELHRFAEAEVHTIPQSMSFFCKLCDVKTVGLILLREHLCTKQHEEKVAALQIEVN